MQYGQAHRAIRVGAALRALREQGVTIGKVYIMAHEMQVVCACAGFVWTEVYRV